MSAQVQWLHEMKILGGQSTMPSDVSSTWGCSESKMGVQSVAAKVQARLQAARASANVARRGTVSNDGTSRFAFTSPLGTATPTVRRPLNHHD
jgi:hypothetical protein